MLEGVLKGGGAGGRAGVAAGFNPWYVGGGVKSPKTFRPWLRTFRFNPWYVGGGVKRKKNYLIPIYIYSFNPWYVGGGVKSIILCRRFWCDCRFQSLVCWRGC